ncbi:hypothetical protein [Gracilibacillus phocaeensis]|uniref:hypothetical protein n=1 Tax=Gracilibacillus phocaeensis TaxID=2042304 RepID=UPI0013EF174B|nr:hypothetical protein [Gracilibacillus phocaeensis]
MRIASPISEENVITILGQRDTLLAMALLLLLLISYQLRKKFKQRIKKEECKKD